MGDDLSRELATIELRLSRMVAAPVNLWNTERLERDAAQLLSRAQTPADRDAVQVTLSKIKQFAVIGQRVGAGAGDGCRAEWAAADCAGAGCAIAGNGTANRNAAGIDSAERAGRAL